MATIHIRDDTYQYLARRAADQNMTIEDLVEPVLDQFARAEAIKDKVPPASDRLKALNDWMGIVRQRASRYPAGFAVDDTRESIYAGRGE